MTQKTHLGTGAAANAKHSLSPIGQIRRGRQPLPAYVSDSAHSPMHTDSAATTKTTASNVYSTDVPLLGQLIGWVRSRTSDRYLKEPEVLTIIGRSKAAMRKDVSLGMFPAQVRTGLKSTGWRESEVMGWVEATTILSRVANPGFEMKEFVAALMASRIPMR
ncbi:putative DNA-binding transcriptional regulator AlpA [Paraburkholderia sp. GAS206C]|uniref:helix-turn-helix transcriptional regulator n=1 Tax=unclassified Paraburkholderia TaxID=2615204 RepID=UPI003D1BA9A4